MPVCMNFMQRCRVTTGQDRGQTKRKTTRTSCAQVNVN